MTIIKHKRGSGVPAAAELEAGELAIDTLAAKLYTKIGNAVVEIGGGSSGDSGGVEEAPEDGVQYARQDAAWEPVETFDDTQISADLAQEVADREAGALDLQGQIDALGSGGGGGSEWELVEAVDLGGASSYEFYGFELGVKQYRLSIPFAYSPTEYRYGIGLYEDMQDCVIDLGKRYTETRMWPDLFASNVNAQVIEIPWQGGLLGDSRSEVIFSGMHDTSTDRSIRVTYENWQGDKYFNAGYFVAPDSGKQFNGFRLYMAKGPAPTHGEARVYKLKDA